MGIERLTEQQKDSLYKNAKHIDNIDRIIGPLATLCYFSGSDYLQTAGNILSGIELISLKLPFILDYLSSTKDTKSLAYWIPKEIISNSYPYTDFIDIAPIYKYRSKYKLGK